MRSVSTPAGACPVKLTAHDERTVLDWADDVLAAGEREGVRYAPEAIRYFVRHFYDMSSAEYKLVCRYLDADYPKSDRPEPPKKTKKPELVAQPDAELDDQNDDDMPPPPVVTTKVVVKRKLTSELGSIARDLSKGGDEEMKLG